MTESVSVCCPSCGSSHTATAAAYPCPCGAPVVPPLLGHAPVAAVTRRAWADEWVTVRCAACGCDGDWPRPELGCPCGTVLRLPVRPAGGTEAAPPPDAPAPTTATPTASAAPDSPGSPVSPDSPGSGQLPPPETPRPSFLPMTIRTSHDAVATAALYLRWLGFKSVVRTGEPPATDGPGSPTDPGVELRGPDVVAQVDPTTTPASVRSVECLWLNGLNASAAGIHFALAGYAEDARARADELGIPLFVLDLTGTPRPVNGPARDLLRTGA
ncbi:hypothetical protein [Streptomyces paludis]|uniref:Restriction endonuclease type IV Mrr domain-containing protein n=1 Tax=Streptomyces paludis TaxID=2282738 RepID=A0A345HWI9_9ACTN|nr:hypothetical protein [Streptomyces paludis]AXG81063.1 hypothetical protein DVK44_29060 [Streptomyces paludis]